MCDPVLGNLARFRVPLPGRRRLPPPISFAVAPRRGFEILDLGTMASVGSLDFADDFVDEDEVLADEFIGQMIHREAQRVADVGDEPVEVIAFGCPMYPNACHAAMIKEAVQSRDDPSGTRFREINVSAVARFVGPTRALV
jgi:hypothetical protein